MPENTRSLEERLRAAYVHGELRPLMLDAADALAAKDKLLGEAIKALEPFAVMADQVDEWKKGTDPKVNFEFSADALRSARTTLANLKAAIEDKNMGKSTLPAERNTKGVL